MLEIFICEDNVIQLNQIKSIVNEYIHTNDLDMGITLAVEQPEKLSAHLEANPVQSGLYFLDVDLRTDINGIELAAWIRNKDLSATIVFITTKEEMAPLVFRFKVEAMDYIIKDSPDTHIKKRIIECIDLSYLRLLKGKHTNIKYFSVKTPERNLNIPYDDILFFEANPDPNLPHHVILYTPTQNIVFRGTLKDAMDIGTEFFLCHKSIVVNMKKIKHVDRKKKEVVMINGDIIPVSRRKLPKLLETWESERLM
ncbi:MAG: LytTR family DNA-binding domain-containing protein [Lachnospiraceae bacterium]|nr:LytTR family DNA-binding domain-containing protein [Lachnospiraceae bacterium]